MSTSGRGPALASGRSRPLVESYVEHGDPLARKIRAALKTSLLRTELVHQDHELESRMRGEPPVRFGWGATAKSRFLSTSITQDGGFGKIEDAPHVENEAFLFSTRWLNWLSTGNVEIVITLAA